MGVISGLLLGLAAFAVAVFGSALSRLLADDFRAWVPRLIEFLIRRAVSNLPEDGRERMDEEWRSHVNDIPGDLWKIAVAADLSRAAFVASWRGALGRWLKRGRPRVIAAHVAIGVIGGFLGNLLAVGVIGGVLGNLLAATFDPLTSIRVVGLTTAVIVGLHEALSGTRLWRGVHGGYAKLVTMMRGPR